MTLYQARDDSKKPGMIITGATGFLGRRLINHLASRYQIYGIGRRTLDDLISNHKKDVSWYLVDIADFDALKGVFNRIKEKGNVEIILHLAGYYDFTGDNHPEYERTNVQGMKNVLELCVPLKPKRFYFTSSVAACPFPIPGESITEKTPPTAPPPYSISKRKGEEMLAEYKGIVPSCILRLAAIFSYWCEYEPLYNFINTWFSGRWNSRILGGHGNWGIPYLHARDLIAFYLAALEKKDELQPYEILQASPNGVTTIREIFYEVTRCYFGSRRHMIYSPKYPAWAGIWVREKIGRMIGRVPFERSWMGQYIDQQLYVDARHTHQRLDWTPRKNLDIIQCIPQMIRNMQNNKDEWEYRFQLAKKGLPVSGYET